MFDSMLQKAFYQQFTTYHILTLEAAVFKFKTNDREYIFISIITKSLCLHPSQKLIISSVAYCPPFHKI